MNFECKRCISSDCFNWSIRHSFGYYDFESMKDILIGCGILPADLYIVKAPSTSC